MKQRSIGIGSRGFSLIEVMVALIVISVGLLGIAKMQAVSLSSTNSARIRSLAAIEAASLASAMHANRGYWAVQTPAAVVTVSSSAVITANDAALATATDCSVGAAAPCTPVQLAAADLQEWVTEMSGMLPGSTSAITCSALSTPLSCTIRIDWTENAVAMNKQESSSPNAAFQTQSYLLYVEP